MRKPKRGKLKLKSNRGAAKRFKVTASGKVKSHRSGHRHNLTKKTTHRKRGMRKATLVAEADTPRVKRMLLA